MFSYVCTWLINYFIHNTVNDKTFKGENDSLGSLEIFAVHYQKQPFCGSMFILVGKTFAVYWKSAECELKFSP